MSRRPSAKIAPDDMTHICSVVVHDSDDADGDLAQNGLAYVPSVHHVEYGHVLLGGQPFDFLDALV